MLEVNKNSIVFRLARHLCSSTPLVCIYVCGMVRVPFKRARMKFLRKCLLFKKQKVDSTGYYGFEDPFPDLISKLRRFMGGIRSAGCWLSRAVGSQNAVVLMLRKQLLLERSRGKYVIPHLLAKYAKLTLAFRS